jgi:hypothetical protein
MLMSIVLMRKGREGKGGKRKREGDVQVKIVLYGYRDGLLV